jgi:Nitronate monooxygenase
VAPTRREVIKTMVAVGAVPDAVGASRAGASQAVSAIALPTPRAKALMDAFGLKYPIFEAPHGNQTSPELCIAVANAGAMGSLAAFIFDSEETARNAVSKVRSATKGNFFVNFVCSLEQRNFRRRWMPARQLLSSRGAYPRRQWSRRCVPPRPSSGSRLSMRRVPVLLSISVPTFWSARVRKPAAT